MDWQTTSSILQGLRNHEDAALWARFVDRFRSPVVRFARSIGVSEHSAEDVAQETLLAFVRHYRDGRYDRDRGRLSQWLFRIAYRQSLAHRRRDTRSAVSPGVDPSEAQVSDVWDRYWEPQLGPGLYRTCTLGIRTGHLRGIRARGPWGEKPGRSGEGTRRLREVGVQREASRGQPHS